MFRRKNKVITAFVLVLLFLFSCAKQEPKSGHKQIDKDYTEQGEIQEQDLSEPTPESSAANSVVQNGIKEYNREEYEKAGRTFESAINMEPSNGEAYYWLAKTNFKMGDMENAKQFLYKASQYLTGDEWEKKLHDLEKEIDSIQPEDLENEDSKDQDQTDSF